MRLRGTKPGCLRSSWPTRAALTAALAAGLASAAHAAPAHSAQLGPAPTGAGLQIVLPLKGDAAGLERFASAVSDPSSPLYGDYASVSELSHRFGAAPNTRANVLRYLRSQGATGVSIDATGLLAEARLSAGLAERLFETPLLRFGANDGGHYVAPALAPSIPPALRGLVDGVVGLDTKPMVTATHLSRERVGRSPGSSRARAAAGQPPSALPRSGTPSGCPRGVSAGEVVRNAGSGGFTPNQYETAYGFTPLFKAGITGQGERVALIEIDGYTASDVSAFAQCFGLRMPHVDTFGVGTVSGVGLPPGGESTLDLEVLTAGAPGLRSIDVYETKSDAADVLRALVAPLQNRATKPQIVSASLGLCERDHLDAASPVGIAAAERSLQLAAASGVTFLAASGDQGSADCTSSSGRPIDRLAVNYPASSRWVTGVGGTNLALTAANLIAGQVVWNDAGDQLAAGGGGISGLFRRPSYQAGFVAPNRRGVPDVSMLADLAPGYAIYCTASPDCLSPTNHSPWLNVGGTSAATPLLAGGLALVDQEHHALGRAALGLANPLLYELGRSSARSSVFFDVTAIGNDIGPYIPGSRGRALGCCAARRGYDEASGLGSVNISQLAMRSIKLAPYILGGIRLSIPAHQRPLASRRIRLTLTCSRPCYSGALVRVTIGHARPFEVDSQIFNLRRGGSQKVTLTFSRLELRALRSALAGSTRIGASAYGVIVTPRGTIIRRTGAQRVTIAA